MSDDSFSFEREDSIMEENTGGDEFDFGGDDFIDESGYDEETGEGESDDEETLFPGMTKREIATALEQELDVDEGTVDPDSQPREELASDLKDVRKKSIDRADDEIDWTDQLEDEQFFENDDAQSRVEDDSESSGEDEQIEDEERRIENEALRSALKQEGVENPRKFTRNQAATILKDAESEISDHQNAIMMLRWHQGIIAASTKVEWGEQTMEKLADQLGMNSTRLRQTRQLVEHFNYDKAIYKKWLHEGDGGSRFWYEARNEFQTEVTDGPDGGGEDGGEENEFLQKILGEIDKLAYRLQQVNDMLEDIEDEETRREVEGATTEAMKEIQRFMSTNFSETGELEDGKDPIPRSERYLEFQRACPCPITDNQAADPHHTETGGTGDKGSDFSTIPLSRELHTELHDHGQSHFEDKYDVDLANLKYSYLHRFVTGQWPEDMQGLPDPKGDW